MFNIEPYKSEGVSRCPCSKFRLRKYLGPSEITLHLYRNGFMPRYWVWTEHGETDELGVNCNEPTTNMEQQGQSRVFEADRNRVGDVNWEDNHERYDEMIHDAFSIDNMETVNGRLSLHLRDIGCIRSGQEQLTQWCRPELKKALYHFWETDEKYKHTKATNKANRASERCAKYTGESATPMKTKAKMTKSLDRLVSMAEVFKQTHTLKENKEKFADKRSTDIWNEYIDNTAIATQRAAESGTSTAESTLRTSVFATQDTSASVTSAVPCGEEDTVDLREQVLLLNQNIHDMAR
ncbi:hypothetical protein PIB30_044040 [Stylosanthes scabra]|uniref:Transposase-associated domain-containing protein n=1 Tax=Stylosanthes scabra TaxID=79078 RepID=A0ABU6RG91_9FABA|nr:hypothetical protein [Stylosanthes scabra]